MVKTLKLLDYKGDPHFFAIENAEDVFCAYMYTCSGDQCACIIYVDGDYVELDSCDDEDRLMSFGPEETDVLLANEIPWETEVRVHEA